MTRPLAIVFVCAALALASCDEGATPDDAGTGSADGGAGEGSAALVATHNERLARKMDRVVKLHEGRLE